MAVQSHSYHEQPMVDWLSHYLRHYVAGTTVTVDAARNVYVTKGTAQFSPCVAAHTDTVHAPGDVSICVEGTRVVGYQGGARVGIGADDKTGIFVCLNLLERFDHIRAVFFATEEVGTIGAKKADAAFFEGIAYLIEYDCPSRNMLSYTCGGERLFTNDGDFIKKAHPVLVKHGTTLWQNHPYTDVMTVRRRFPISCLNLSSGYYNWHRHTEFASLPDVELAIGLGTELVKTLDHVRYECPVDLKDEATPLIEVGALHVPKAQP